MKKAKFIPLHERTSYQRLEDVIGCKWSTAVVAAVSQGVKRPGELERYIPGISTKVLNERLRKLVNFGLLKRTEYDGLPARVDYDLTPTGHKLAGILAQLRAFNDEIKPPARIKTDNKAKSSGTR
jgi:DNA-binding HxlR family transcriptional regulator